MIRTEYWANLKSPCSQYSFQLPYPTLIFLIENKELP